jgi:multidrug resistance efflux pump
LCKFIAILKLKGCCTHYFRERREEQESRVTYLMDRLISNKEQKAVAAAAREAAKAKRLEQEARLNLLRQQLAEAEAQAAAAATEVTHADVTIEQLALEARISTGSNQRVVKRSWKSTRRFLPFSWRLLYFCNAYFFTL